MTTDLITTDDFKNRFADLKEKHLKKMVDLQYRIS
jgi:hypothetical protein